MGKNELNISFEKNERDITYIVHCNKFINNQGRTYNDSKHNEFVQCQFQETPPKQ